MIGLSLAGEPKNRADALIGYEDKRDGTRTPMGMQLQRYDRSAIGPNRDEDRARGMGASGRNEDKSFGMVEQLAEMSAQNRGVTLPDTGEAGSRFGKSIKKEHQEPDQLLYAVVTVSLLVGKMYIFNNGVGLCV